MHRTLWLSLVAVLAFSALIVVSYSMAPSDALRAWLPQFLIEFTLSLLATIYIWRLAWLRHGESWLLWLLATCSLLLTLGLIPATLLVIAEMADIAVLGEHHPIMGIGVLMLFTGIVAPIMGGTLWWKRNRG